MYMQVHATTTCYVSDFETLKQLGLPRDAVYIGRIVVEKPLTPAQLRRVHSRIRDKVCSEQK